MASNFRVIIAGGGPAGLVAAHSLHLAGIDFTVLEQRDDIAIDVGASLVLSPQSLRVFHQFGLYDRLMEIGAEIDHNLAMDKDGFAFGDSRSFKYLKENHGSAPVVFHRAHLIQAIYDGLPEAAKSRILTGKKIKTVISTSESVTVTCTDGSVHVGSVLIGADGVHSQTRHLMRKLALEQNPLSNSTTELDWDPETPYVSEYKALWCSFPAATEPGIMTETHNRGQSVMYIAGKTRGWVFLYERLPVKTQAHTRYTNEDCLAFAEAYADYSITDTLKVKDVFVNRYTVGMSNLEQGVVKHWTYGRIALVGDAAHKYTPNGGLGFNNGIQDVVALCNGLTTLVKSTASASTTIPLLSLHETFETYQSIRSPLAIQDYETSIRTTRIQADANMFYYLLSRYFLWIELVRYVLIKWIAPRSIRKGLVLDYVHDKAEPFAGRVDWEHPLVVEEEEEKKK